MVGGWAQHGRERMGLLRKVQERWQRATSPAHVRQHLAAYDRWLADRAEERRYNFPELRRGAVVVDLGGYQGEWAAGVTDRYDTHVHIFEAHPRFADDMAKRFAEHKRIAVHPVALASTSGTFSITDDGVASKADTGGSVKCQSVEAKAYLAWIGVTHIDLLKVNIEGGEYDIIPYLIETGLIANIDTIQVQFHRNSADDEKRREKIIEQLRHTHDRTWCYHFVWEEWKIRRAHS